MEVSRSGDQVPMVLCARSLAAEGDLLSRAAGCYQRDAIDLDSSQSVSTHFFA